MTATDCLRAALAGSWEKAGGRSPPALPLHLNARCLTMHAHGRKTGGEVMQAILVASDQDERDVLAFVLTLK